MTLVIMWAQQAKTTSIIKHIVVWFNCTGAHWGKTHTALTQRTELFFFLTIMLEFKHFSVITKQWNKTSLLAECGEVVKWAVNTTCFFLSYFSSRQVSPSLPQLCCASCRDHDMWLARVQVVLQPNIDQSRRGARKKRPPAYTCAGKIMAFLINSPLLRCFVGSIFGWKIHLKRSAACLVA